MSPSKLLVLTALTLWLVVPAGTSRAQVSVLSYHNDLSSTGQNLSETKLTPVNVNANQFGKIFSTSVDGQVYGQPLYFPGVAITAGKYAGTTHDTAFVVTQNDSVYAIDAVSGAIVWQTSLLGNGEVPVPQADTSTTDITPEVGIVSTPVIDPTPNPNTQLRYMYVVAKSRVTVSGVPYYYLRLHALDIASGTERSGSPVVIAETGYANGTYTYVSGPSVAGTGDGSVSGRVTFNALRQNQRPGLTLLNGQLYLAFSSHGDNGPYHGWVLGYSTSAMQLTAAFNATPNGGEGGIWMGGGIPAADSAGSLYVVTGNGSFANANANTAPAVTDFASNGFPANHDYGDSVLRLVLDGTTSSNPNANGWGLKVADYFTPYNQETLNNGDTDLGSGGPLLLPASAGSAAHPNLLVCAGKQGTLYLLDRSNLGKFRGGIVSGAFASTGDAVVEESVPSEIQGSLDTPGYFNGLFYYTGAYNNDTGKAFGVANGVFTTNPASQTSDTFGYLGCSPSISASSATANGIVWCLDRGTNQLRAYDATNLASELYNSGQAAGSRDALGTAVKFGTVTVADGHVLVGTGEPSGPSALVAYGLLTAATNPPAQPDFLFAQTVSGGEIDLFWDDEADNETGYQIYYSTNPNSFPTSPNITTSANVTDYAVAGLQVNTTYYFRICAVNGVGTSAFSDTAATTSGAAPPVDFTNGFASANSLLSVNGYNGALAVVGSVLRLTDGNTSEARSAWYNTAQNIATFSTQFTFLLTNPTADGFTFTVQRAGVTALGASGGDLGYEGIGNSAAVKFDIYPSLSTTGLYFNGVAPDDSTTSPANPTGPIDVTAAGINFHAGVPLQAVLTYDGTTLTETITNLITRASFTHAYTPINLVSKIGGSTAYVGFTAGTGGSTSTQDIQSWSFTSTLPTAPNAPSGLTVTPASATQFNLAWTDNSNNETSFRIERALGNGAFLPVGSVGANTMVYIDPNLITNTTYSYRVFATDDGIDSAASNVVTATTPVPPNTPTGATSTLVTATEVDFTWNDNSNNETGFTVLRQAGSGNFINIASLPPNTTIYKDTGLSPGTTYNYHIEAYNAAGYVDFTGFEVTTLASVNVVTSTPTAQEDTGTAGIISVRCSPAPTAPLTVNYTIMTGNGQAAYGARYTLTPAPTTVTTGSVVIPANANAATITVNPGTDTTLLGQQSVTLVLSTGTGYSITGGNTASVNLLDTPLNTWKIQEFGSLAAASSPQAADEAEYGDDGIPNLLEYALGGNPVLSSTSVLPTAQVKNVDGGVYLTLTYQTPNPLPGDITYIVEACTNLAAPAWQTTTTVGGFPMDNGDGTETWKVRTTWLESAYPESFIRLRVTRP